MAISETRFLSKINKENLNNLVILVGEDTYYRDLINKKVLQIVYKDASDDEREIYVFDKKIDLNEVSATINTFPFFAGKSIVLLKDLQLLEASKKGLKLTGNDDGSRVKKTKTADDKKKEDLEKLLIILSDIPEYCTVCLYANKIDKRSKFYKTLSKNNEIIECESLKSYQVGQWIREKGNEAGVSWEPSAIRLIEEYMMVTDTVPLLLLNSELEKIITYCYPNKKITRKAVEEIFSELPEVSRFALTNAISAKDIKKVLKILAFEKRKNVSVIEILGIISYEFKKNLKVKELMERGYNKGLIVSKLKMNPYAAQMTMESAGKFSQMKLERALFEITELNMDMRIGGRQYSKLEEILIMLLT